nr:MAG TPA: hypothetical protein [Caudoviricetes sp.]
MLFQFRVLKFSHLRLSFLFNYVVLHLHYEIEMMG